MSILDEIISERPRFHTGETETTREISTDETSLPQSEVDKLMSHEAVCYGIGPEAARFLHDTVQPDYRTLETGCGISTLMFAMKGSTHVTITPNASETENLKQYASTKGIDVSKVTFVTEPSDSWLPTCDATGLDMVFIDGKHAFPWPIIDWFYTADRLKKGGLMIVDDAHLRPLGILRDFMNEDPRWELAFTPDPKTLVYRKCTDSVHDVAWHMQPYVIGQMPKESGLRYFARRVKAKLLGR